MAGPAVRPVINDSQTREPSPRTALCDGGEAGKNPVFLGVMFDPQARGALVVSTAVRCVSWPSGVRVSRRFLRVCRYEDGRGAA